jgi:SAM-dependent methyltransferase
LEFNFDMTSQEKRTFRDLSQGSFRAARHVLPLFRELFEFNSVIDVGCGSGEWLKVAKTIGVERVIGLDLEPISNTALRPDEFCRADLSRGFTARPIFDLCICLEVAEHLPRERSSTLVRDLCRLSDCILFSAAIPHQGGYGHLNEQWPEFWSKKFLKRGFMPWTGLRDAIWSNRQIPWWYRQNLIVYVREKVWKTILPGAEPGSPRDLTKIHPECLLSKTHGSPGAATNVPELVDYYAFTSSRC